MKAEEIFARQWKRPSGVFYFLRYEPDGCAFVSCSPTLADAVVKRYEDLGYTIQPDNGPQGFPRFFHPNYKRET